MSDNVSSLSNTTEDPNSSTYSTAQLVLITGVNFIVCCMVLVNNSLMLITLARTRQLWTLTNAYIASLSVADLLVGVVLIVRHFWLIPATEDPFNENEFLCMPFICLLYVSALESIACLTLVSTDRYLYIVHPYWYERNITARVTRMLIIGSWVMSTTLGFLPMSLNNFTSIDGCSPMTIISKYYLLYCLSSYFFLAATIITFMYCRVFCVGNQQRRKIEASTPSASTQSRKEQSRWQVIRFLLLVCGLFFACWLPLVITVIFYFTIGAPVAAISITVSISGVNSSLNLYVFTTMNRTFKNAVRKLICCCRNKTVDPMGKDRGYPSAVDSSGVDMGTYNRTNSRDHAVLSISEGESGKEKALNCVQTDNKRLNGHHYENATFTHHY